MTARLRRLLPSVLVSALLLLAASAAHATQTRVLALGGDADTFEDLANVLRWYGTLPSYGNTAILELGRLEDGGSSAAEPGSLPRGGGVHADLDSTGRAGTIGLYLFKPQNPLRVPGARILMYGRAWNGAQAALLAGESSRSFKVKDATGATVHEENDENVFLGLGGRWDIGPRTYADVAGEWRRADFDYRDRDLGLDLSNTSGRSFGLRARLFHKVSESVAIVPVASHARDDRWSLMPGTGAPGRLDAWDTRLGVGLNVFPGENLLGVASLEWRRGEERWRTPTPGGDVEGPLASFRVLVARLGLEGQLRSWLTLRAGVVSAGDHGAWPGASSFGLARDFDLTLGLGLHLGGFDADFLFADEAPYNLGSLLTNAGAGQRSTFTGISLAYAF